MFYRVNNFKICYQLNYLQHKCVHLFENIFKLFRNASVFHTRVVNQTVFIVTKLQFIRIKAKLVYVAR